MSSVPAGVALTGCVAIGESALIAPSITTGADNTVAIGASALAALETGTGNVAIGFQASQNVEQGDNNIALGHQALYTMGGADGNDDNIAIVPSAAAVTIALKAPEPIPTQESASTIASPDPCPIQIL